MTMKPSKSNEHLRLTELVEVEVSQETGESKKRTLCDAPKPESLECCIAELVECLEQLDGADSASKVADSADLQKSALEAVSEMEAHIRRFQKQSAALKRLITKVH